TFHHPRYPDRQAPQPGLSIPDGGEDRSRHSIHNRDLNWQSQPEEERAVWRTVARRPQIRFGILDILAAALSVPQRKVARSESLAGAVRRRGEDGRSLRLLGAARLQEAVAKPFGRGCRLCQDSPETAR